MSEQDHHNSRGMFDRAHQERIGNLDLTYDEKGLTLSGHLLLRAGKSGAEQARQLGEKLLLLSGELEALPEIAVQEPQPVENPFGSAFDDQ